MREGTKHRLKLQIMDLESVLVSLFFRLCLVQDYKYCRKEAIVLQIADWQVIKY